MNKGRLYLIPVPIADGAVQTLSPAIGNTTATLKHFFYTQYRRSLPWRGDNYSNDNQARGQYMVDGISDVKDVPLAY